MQVYLPLYCTSSISRSPNIFLLTRKEQEKRHYGPFERSGHTMHAPKVKHTSPVPRAHGNKERTISRYNKLYSQYAQKKSALFLAFSSDVSAVCPCRSGRLFECPLRITECYRKFICVQSRNTRNARNHLRKN